MGSGSRESDEKGRGAGGQFARGDINARDDKKKRVGDHAEPAKRSFV